MDVPFFSIRKLRGKGIVYAAAKHNLREFVLKGEGEHGAIEEERTHLNQVLRGDATALGVARYAQSLMTQAGIKSLRKDAVLGLQPLPFAATPVWALPNPSGLNAHYQLPELARIYEQLARQLG